MCVVLLGFLDRDWKVVRSACEPTVRIFLTGFVCAFKTATLRKVDRSSLEVGIGPHAHRLDTDRSRNTSSRTCSIVHL